MEYRIVANGAYTECASLAAYAARKFMNVMRCLDEQLVTRVVQLSSGHDDIWVYSVLLPRHGCLSCTWATALGTCRHERLEH